ncbi:MAG: adenylosuccinate lyase [Gemmatimonadetes bacterium]|nr:adenylosuccinate lyase [Gemmatimonadota bacterium]
MDTVTPGPAASERYESPLLTRYASPAMSVIFSERRTVLLWRRIWLALAETQRELGVDIREEQLAALRANVDRIDFEAAAAHERELRHDVMAHVHAYGDAAPAARGVLHLGATSADITDNANLLQLREALELVRGRVLDVLRPLAAFARRWAELPTLGFTHFQAAQPTTVGKRACLWIQDLLLDLAEVERRTAGLRLRGFRGATGTQASFLALFDGDAGRVEELERRMCARLGFGGTYAVTGQTYPRKVDALVLDALSGVGQSCAKFAHDLRLLQHLHEVEEPFGERQIGSSAMPYKRNPMRAERMSGLARWLIVTAQNAGWTAAGQWLERTLDDSSNRRLALPEAFLSADALLVLYRDVVEGLAVSPEAIRERLRTELPFLASEMLLAEGVKRGGDRQSLHEAIRRHSLAARGPDANGDREAASSGGPAERFLAALESDDRFPFGPGELAALLTPEAFTGLAAEQVERFLTDEVDPLLEARSSVSVAKGEVRV